MPPVSWFLLQLYHCTQLSFYAHTIVSLIVLEKALWYTQLSCTDIACEWDDPEITTTTGDSQGAAGCAVHYFLFRYFNTNMWQTFYLKSHRCPAASQKTFQQLKMCLISPEWKLNSRFFSSFREIHKTFIVLSSVSFLITEEPNYMTGCCIHVPLTGQITVVWLMMRDPFLLHFS